MSEYPDRTCLNPNCDTGVLTIGVCVSCAQTGAYDPGDVGVEIRGFVYRPSGPDIVKRRKKRHNRGIR